MKRLITMAYMALVCATGCASRSVIETISDAPNYCGQLVCLSVKESYLKDLRINSKRDFEEVSVKSQERIVLTADFAHFGDARCDPGAVITESSAQAVKWTGCLSTGASAAKDVAFTMTYTHGGGDKELLNIPVSAIWPVLDEQASSKSAELPRTLGDAVIIKRK